MARFFTDDYIVINNFKNLHAVSWEISTDSNFNTLIDSTYINTEDKYSWFSKLLNTETNITLRDNDTIFVRCKIHFYTPYKIYDSPWYSKQIGLIEKPKHIKITNKDKVIGEIIQNPDGSITKVW